MHDSSDIYPANEKKNEKSFFNFSIIMAVYNTEKFLKETIDSIINQTLSFEDNVQLILVDDGSTDNSKEILLSYQRKYPKNIIVITQENQRQASARNNGLRYAEGKYVNFLDSDDKFAENVLEDVLKFFEKNESNIDVVALPLFLFGREEGEHLLNYKFSESRVINLEEEPNNPQLHVASAFIKKDAINDFKFDTRLISSEDALFINKILLDKRKYGVLNSAKYYYRKRDDQNSTIDTMRFNKKYYNDRLKYHFTEIINYSLEKYDYVPKFIQYMMAYDLQWMINLDISFLTDEETNEFWHYLNYVISYIDLYVILDNPNIREFVLSFFVFLKNKKQYHIEIEDNNKVLLKTEDYLIDKLETNNVWLDIVEIKDNFLNISGCITSHFKNDSISIKLIKENESGNFEIIPSREVKYNAYNRNTISFLNIDWKYCYNFDVKIPISPYEKSKFSFRIIYYENYNLVSCKPNIKFGYMCSLSNSNTYFIKDNHIIVFKNNNLEISQCSTAKHMINEIKTLKNILINRDYGYKKAIPLRIIYYLMIFNYKNKNTYLFMDRINQAGDNSEYLFKYAEKIDDDISKYFVVDGKSSDYSRLSSHKNIVKYDSIKHKLLYLMADKIIISHPEEQIINPFYSREKEINQRKNYAGLMLVEKYFIQHGVTKDNMSFWLHKFDKNLALLLTTSDLEKKSFLTEGYNYDESIIQSLGFPRFDYLGDIEVKKQILFIPTWRNKLDTLGVLLNSEYYKNINSILHNEVLIELLKKYGYTLLFKAHPRFEEVVNENNHSVNDIFDVEDVIKISTAKSYSELFNESALMITDYSSVFFDFAYLKKPLIYFQPNESYHYDKGYFDNESMGFGEVIKDETHLVEKIRYYLEHDCLMEEFYKDRVDSFFKFNDKNNCERVYGWIKEH